MACRWGSCGDDGTFKPRPCWLWGRGFTLTTLVDNVRVFRLKIIHCRYSTYVLAPSRFDYTDLESEKWGTQGRFDVARFLQLAASIVQDQRYPWSGWSTIGCLEHLGVFPHDKLELQDSIWNRFLHVRENMHHTVLLMWNRCAFCFFSGMVMKLCCNKAIESTTRCRFEKPMFASPWWMRK